MGICCMWQFVSCLLTCFAWHVFLGPWQLHIVTFYLACVLGVRDVRVCLWLVLLEHILYLHIPYPRNVVS